MQRYYSHYTFIYPDKIFKNHIVTLDKFKQIVSCQPFNKETAHTFFHSGILFLIPISINATPILVDNLKKKLLTEINKQNTELTCPTPDSYNVYDENLTLININKYQID